MQQVDETIRGLSVVTHSLSASRLIAAESTSGPAPFAVHMAISVSSGSCREIELRSANDLVSRSSHHYNRLDLRCCCRLTRPTHVAISWPVSVDSPRLLVCPAARPSVCTFVWLFICPFVRPYIYLSERMSIRLSVHPCSAYDLQSAWRARMCPSVRQPIHPSFHPSAQ